MDLSILSALNAARAARRAAILATRLDAGEERLFIEGDEAEGEMNAHLTSAFRSGVSRSVVVGSADWFLNVHLPPPRIIAIGAVHITQALAPMARIAGYDFEIIDPRTAFATPERFPGITLHAEWPQDVLERRPFDAYTAVAAVTHDPKVDDPALMAALAAGCFYVGALGSRKTHARRVERLAALGATEDMLRSIRAPIGLPIGAASPAEIAVAVLAEIIGAFRSRGLAGAAPADATS